MTVFGLLVVLTVTISSISSNPAKSIAPTVINGVNGLDTDYPYMCVLRKPGALCGCVLVSRKIVLTAAHCITDIPTEEYSVVLGLQRMTQISSEIRSGDAMKYDVKSVKKHPSYVDVGTGNDIAVVKLTKTVELRNDIKPIRQLAWDSNKFVGNSDCWISGFGRIDSENDELSADNLQVANVNVRSQQTCTDINGKTVEGTVCLFNGFNQESGCFGDSGGPLVCGKKGKKQVLLGVTSFGPLNCDSYSIYTSVASHRPWLISMGVI